MAKVKCPAAKHFECHPFDSKIHAIFRTRINHTNFKYIKSLHAAQKTLFFFTSKPTYAIFKYPNTHVQL